MMMQMSCIPVNMPGNFDPPAFVGTNVSFGLENLTDIVAKNISDGINMYSYEPMRFFNRTDDGEEEVPIWEKARTFVKIMVVPAICVFGLLGNALTLLVLTRKRLKSSCDGTERTVNIGLLALAVSDFMCCFCLLPHGLLTTEQFEYHSRSFHLVYRTYGDALINTFILTSTWLTVVMAMSR